MPYAPTTVPLLGAQLDPRQEVRESEQRLRNVGRHKAPGPWRERRVGGGLLGRVVGAGRNVGVVAQWDVG